MEEHRKKRKSYDDEPGVHALTFSCYRRRPFLNDPKVRELFLESLGRARNRHGFLLWAYVLMPEHVHLVISTQGARVRSMLKAIKQPTTQRTVRFLKECDPNRLAWMISGMKRANSPYSLWQGGGTGIPFGADWWRSRKTGLGLLTVSTTRCRRMSSRWIDAKCGYDYGVSEFR
jgi:putative transposase